METHSPVISSSSLPSPFPSPFSRIPREIVCHILSLSNLAPSEGRLVSLVCRDWRDLGQAIVWIELVVRAEEDANALQAQLDTSPLFHPDSAPRLACYVQYLTAEGISLFDETATTLQRDDELDPFAAAQTWSAALLQRCTSLKRLFAVNFHSLLLVTIFEGLKASKRTLRGVVWIDCGLGHPYFLSGLEIARAHITAAEGRAVFANLVWLSRGSRLPIQASTSESKSLLPLTSLALFDPTQEGKGNITTLFSFVRKETLRSVEINGQLGEEFVRGLSTDGYLLVFLSLTIHSPSPHGFLTAITHLLSYHPFLVSFMLSFRPSSPLPDYEGDGITLPRSLLEALPQPIHSFNLYMHVKLDEGTLNEFLGARRRTSLQTFVVEAKVDDEWEKQDLISSVAATSV